MTLEGLFELMKSRYYIPEVRLNVVDELGPCDYCLKSKTITIRTLKRSHEEQLFSLLHEVRHAIQDQFKLFKFDLNQCLNSNDYFSYPWEIDANNWAQIEGSKLGLFERDFLPWWLL